MISLANDRRLLDDLRMLLRNAGRSVILLGLLLSSSIHAEQVTPVPKERQLIRISASEADMLIAKLEHAQKHIGDDDYVTLELSSGSMVSLDMARLSPRDAFLRMPFKRVWEVERLTADRRLPQRFRLSYSPNGLGNLYWNIDVDLGLDDNVTRVSMMYEAPAPF